MMESADTSIEASTAFIDRAMELLPRSDYEHFIRLICINKYLSPNPNPFREKMKFVFRNHQHLVPELNPLLPDEYQFSEQELLYEVEDYKGVEKYQIYIKFLNNLKNRVLRPADLRSFHDMVQSHKRKEINAKELYGRAYDLLRGDFGLMKQLSDILRDPVPGDDSLTPSYVGLPMHVLKETSSSKDEVLNSKLRVNDTCRGGNQPTDPSHWYSIDELIKACLDPRPPSRGAQFWCEDRNYELDNLLLHLKLAERKLNKVFKKIKRGEINGASALREHLNSDKVKRKLRWLLERMFTNLEDLISQPHESFPVILNKVRLTKERVARARLQLNNKLYA